MPDDPLTIPVEGQGADKVATEFEKLHEGNMAAMGQSIVRFQGDAVTISKAADYSYLQGKDMVSLAEALGAREVASETNPGGPSKPIK